ncbi:MAG: molybdenum cofactor guanylyltransferase [Synechococcaceae cyanobacterium]|nr:molybdenum cofactor guanylyltransferase [Synechococcaceae cyanobacterium]
MEAASEAAAALPLRACLLSGGDSRRMGRDKALLPHPAGGSWLEHSLERLLELQLPVTLFSRHGAHLALAARLAELRRIPPAAPGGPPTPGPGASRPDSSQDPGEWLPGDGPGEQGLSLASGRLTVLVEPPPWEGPLLALQRLMERYPQQRLLLCPVDMPWLTPATLSALVEASERDPQQILLAHDGQRLQPLLGIYPAQALTRRHLAEAVRRGERRLQRWLQTQEVRALRLDPRALGNVNRPEEWRQGPLAGDGCLEGGLELGSAPWSWVSPAAAPAPRAAADRRVPPAAPPDSAPGPEARRRSAG